MRTAIICAAISISGMIYHIAHLIRPDVVPLSAEWGQIWPCLAFVLGFSIWDIVEMKSKNKRDQGEE